MRGATARRRGDSIVVRDARRFLCRLATSTRVSARSAGEWTTTFSRSCDQPLALQDASGAPVPNTRVRSDNDVFGRIPLSGLLSPRISVAAGQRRCQWRLHAASAGLRAGVGLGLGLGFCRSGTRSAVDQWDTVWDCVMNSAWLPGKVAMSAPIRLAMCNNMA